MPRAKKVNGDESSNSSESTKSESTKSSKSAKSSKKLGETKTYNHSEQSHPARPDIGTEKSFKKRKPPVNYRYDSSLSPALEWDNNTSRLLAEWLIGVIERAAKLEAPHIFAEPEMFFDADGEVVLKIRGLDEAVQRLKALSQPFLNWAGKGERLSFDVPTLPLFIHERLSTRAIIETLKGHKVGDEQLSLFELFSDAQLSIADQVLKAYEYQDQWVNRMILGDSLLVMNSLLQYEGLAGKVQMIYMDPPYGVKFGSNFQPFVRKRDVKHNEDDDLSREPEMVQAYRDTWQLGLHSYLSYLKDRLLLARDLLADSGSVFVQISDENVHHVRELMDEVFGCENFVSLITFRKKNMPFGANYIEGMVDYLLWYGKDYKQVKFRHLFIEKDVQGASRWNLVELADGTHRIMTGEEWQNHKLLPPGSKVYRHQTLKPSGTSSTLIFDVEFNGKIYHPPKGGCWATTKEGMQRAIKANRIGVENDNLHYRMYLKDYPVTRIDNLWSDTSGASDKLYVVQTMNKVIQRCLLMTTDPGDLVLDLTCGSGTTAYVAEQWGRRWITCDVSRVPLALARQRLLTATFPYYELKNENQGPAGGFVYERKQNKKGEEVGGIVPHVTLKSIANNEPPETEILVDRPETINSITRVSGPFTLEGTIPPPLDLTEEIENSDDQPSQNIAQINDNYTSLTDRLLEVLRYSPVIRLDNNQTVTLENIRSLTRTISLSAEAEVNGEKVAILFGPENGAIAERTIHEAAKEADMKNYQHLYVIGFAIAPNARELLEKLFDLGMVKGTYIQATPDILMGDLLKNMKSSQIFSVCGLPDIDIIETDDHQYKVKLLGLDVFDPVTMEVDHKKGDDVPAWFLDTNYNGLCFHVCQAFFPRTNAWDNLKKTLKGTYDDSVWEHLASNISSPFTAGDHREIAVKVIDDRGNELLVVKKL
jgi:adenine-specific DNA-methyltransferase